MALFQTVTYRDDSELTEALGAAAGAVEAVRRGLSVCLDVVAEALDAAEAGRVDFSADLDAAFSQPLHHCRFHH